eukprot:g4638.t1
MLMSGISKLLSQLTIWPCPNAIILEFLVFEINQRRHTVCTVIKIYFGLLILTLKKGYYRHLFASEIYLATPSSLCKTGHWWLNTPLKQVTGG